MAQSRKTGPKEGKTKTDAQAWLDRIDRAKKVRDEWKGAFRVQLAYYYLEGRQRPPDITENEWMTINLFYSTLRAVLPTLYRTDPYFYVNVKRSYQPNPMAIAQFEMNAEVRQGMLNYLKGELNLKDKTRLAILDAFFQYGVCKVFYKADLVENPDAGGAVLDDDGIPMIDDTGNPMMEPETLPANEAYCVTRIHPNDFLVDEDAGPLEDDVKWMAQRILTPIDDVKGDKRYPASIRNTIKPTEVTDQTEKDRERRKKGSVYAAGTKIDAEVVVIWEVYDLKKKQWFQVAEGNPEFLIKPDDLPKGTEKHPFVFIKWFPRDDSWYPIPPATQWLDPQREYCELRSKVLTHRKRFNRKYTAYTPGLQDEGELTKLELGEDGTIIRVTAPGSSITPILDAPLDQNHFQELLVLRKDFEDVAVGPNQRGSAQGVDSATEAGIIEKRTLIQEGDDISRVIDFVTRIAEKLDQLIQQYITGDQAVKVTGADGEASWQFIRANAWDDVDAEYQYSVNVGTAMPQLPEIERSQWLAFLTALSSAPQLALSRKLLMETAKMFHIEDESMVDEIQKIAQQMVSGQLPMPGPQGSAPGSPALPGSAQGAGMGINNMRGG